MKQCKRQFLLALALLGLSGIIHSQDASAQSAVDIIYKSRNRINAETTSIRSRMIIVDKNGASSEQVMDQYEKKDAKGNNRTVAVFQSPASIKGARFLTLENKGKPNDQMIYLPALGKVRRIAASEGSGSFMGTDLSYDDVSSSRRDTDLDTHTLLREENYRGSDCYVIESVPLDKKYQYSKMVQWIDKNTFVPHKVELYNSKGRQVKLLEMLELAEKQGRLTAMLTRMTTLPANPGDRETSTSIRAEIVKYDDPIPESVFTENYLLTGRAR